MYAHYRKIFPSRPVDDYVPINPVTFNRIKFVQEYECTCTLNCPKIPKLKCAGNMHDYPCSYQS